MYQLAATVKEFYDSLRVVGFNNQQAITLTGEWLKGMTTASAMSQGPDTE